jgi:hypothetical protein
MRNDTDNRFRREPQSLEAWESWVDHLIVTAQEQGAFDNLSTHGKPLELDDNPLAGGLEVGFGLLKNANAAPFWIEIDKEMRAAAEEMARLLARATEIARARAATPELPAPRPEPARSLGGRLWSFLWPSPEIEPLPEPAYRPGEAELTRLRTRYLERAEELERAIRQYNAAIPRDLWWLERTRRTVADAATDWDRALVLPRTEETA